MNESQLQTLIEPWFEGMEQASLFSAITATGLGMLAILLLYFFLRSLMLPGVQSLAAKLSPERITMLAPLLQKLNRRVAGIICCVVFLAF